MLPRRAFWLKPAEGPLLRHCVFAVRQPHRSRLFPLQGWLSLLGFLLLATSLVAQPSTELPTYRRGGFSSINQLGRALFKALKPVYRDQIHFLPVSLETEPLPFVRLEEYKDPDSGKVMRMAFVSVGFIQLINNVAHAKAIDKIEKGFFDKYVALLAQEKGDKFLSPIPNIQNPAYWTDDMMNEQESNFSQMAGILLGIELSHHYLGHFKKYSDKLTSDTGAAVPINTLLLEQEWLDSFKAGVWDALNAGYSIEGVRALYEAIEKMPPGQRPVWTQYFFPQTIKFARIKKDLKRFEDYFFANREP